MAEIATRGPISCGIDAGPLSEFNDFHWTLFHSSPHFCCCCLSPFLPIFVSELHWRHCLRPVSAFAITRPLRCPSHSLSLSPLAPAAATTTTLITSSRSLAGATASTPSRAPPVGEGVSRYGDPRTCDPAPRPYFTHTKAIFMVFFRLRLLDCAQQLGHVVGRGGVVPHRARCQQPRD